MLFFFFFLIFVTVTYIYSLTDVLQNKTVLRAVLFSYIWVHSQATTCKSFNHSILTLLNSVSNAILLYFLFFRKYRQLTFYCVTFVFVVCKHPALLLRSPNSFWFLLPRICPFSMCLLFSLSPKAFRLFSFFFPPGFQNVSMMSLWAE